MSAYFCIEDVKSMNAFHPLTANLLIKYVHRSTRPAQAWRFRTATPESLHVIPPGLPTVNHPPLSIGSADHVCRETSTWDVQYVPLQHGVKPLFCTRPDQARWERVFINLLRPSLMQAFPTMAAAIQYNPAEPPVEVARCLAGMRHHAGQQPSLGPCGGLVQRLPIQSPFCVDKAGNLSFCPCF